MENGVIRVLIVDDHPLMRVGIATVVTSDPEMTVVGEATNGSDALELFKTCNPDITLMDIRMGKSDGIEAIKKIRRLNPQARVIVLTSAEGDIHAKHALESGASSYLLKSHVRTDLVETILLVHAGYKHVSPEIATQLASHAHDEEITPRELGVLRALARGLSNRLIGKELGITEDTVKNNLKRILSKLDAGDRTHAVVIAVERGFIEM